MPTRPPQPSYPWPQPPPTTRLRLGLGAGRPRGGAFLLGAVGQVVAEVRAVMEPTSSTPAPAPDPEPEPEPTPTPEPEWMHEDWGGWYCSANQGIYLHDSTPDRFDYRVAGLDFILAHEYGHAVLGRNGMGTQVRYLQQRQAGDEALVLETNRRMEGQTDCVAGVGLQSLWPALGHDDDDLRGTVELVRTIVDDPERAPRTHDAADTRAHWFGTGFRASTYGDCNTYGVPSARVR